MQKKHLAIKIWIDLLTFLAGFLNGGLFLQAGIAVGHHSGNITRFALSLISSKETVFLLLLLFFFCVGSTISGFIFHDRHFKMLKRYGILLIIFSVLLFFIAKIKPSLHISLATSCMILGMQNGMFIFYKDIVIRTTHFTGYLTDAGIALGMVMRGKRQELRRFLFYISAIICFVMGSTFAMFISCTIFFYVVACLYFFVGLFYFMIRLLFRF